MCGDIMSIWNVKSVVSGLIHRTGTVNVALMNVVLRLGNNLHLNINRPTSTKRHYGDGTSHQRGRRLRSGIEVSPKPKHSQFSVSKDIKTATPINAKHGTENMGIDAGIIMQDTLTETLLNRSLIYSVINAFNVVAHQLRLTILYHYRKVVQTISTIYGHCVNPVTLERATDESYL